MYQIKMTLKWSNPKIWRRVLVPSDMKLGALHTVIQVVMGWENDHMHQFVKSRICYAPKFNGDFMFDKGSKGEYSKQYFCHLYYHKQQYAI